MENSYVEFFRDHGFQKPMGIAKAEIGSKGKFEGSENDCLSSMRIRCAPGVTFTLYKDHGWSNNPRTWNGSEDVDKSDLQSAGLHDSASSWEFRDENGKLLNNSIQTV